MDLMRVLFICSGNTFRSPFAERYFNYQAGLKAKSWRSISRGIYASQNAKAHPEIIRIAGTLGVDLASHRSKKVAVQDISQSSVVFIMEEEHMTKLSMMRGFPELLPNMLNLGDYCTPPRANIEDILITDIDSNADFPFSRIENSFKNIIQAVNQVLNIFTEK